MRSLPFLLAAAAATSPVLAQVNSSIIWTPCDADPSLSCTSITVPKNYFDPSKGHSTIALAKVSANVSSEEYLGILYVNPGGPGGSGVGLMMDAPDLLTSVTGGRYDIIGFDPRGVGASTTRIDCFPSTADALQFKAGTILEKKHDIPPNPFSHDAFVTMTNQQIEAQAILKAWYSVCRGAIDLEDLKQSGSSTVVRDLEEITMQLSGPDAKINFVGFSYGTILGAYLISMLPPSKIGRIVLDGIANTKLWATTPVYTISSEAVASSEATYQWFLTDCAAAGPEGCALASQNSTAASIQARLDTFMNDLYYNPAPVVDTYRPGTLNSGLVRSFLYETMSQPGGWPHAARALSLAMAGQPKQLYEQMILPFNYTDPDGGDTARQAVSCADTRTPSPVPSPELLADKMQMALKISPHFGGTVKDTELDGGCEFWADGKKAEGTFTGPFNPTLEHPILLMSNTADPVTSLKSGRALNKLLGQSSRLVVQNYPGHTSQIWSLISKCAQDTYMAYLINGTLPKNLYVCEPDNPSLFGLTKENNATALAKVEAFADQVLQKAKTLYFD